MGRKAKEINISMIAREAGVSESTVSRALNHRANVGEATRKKIHALAKSLNFTLTPAAPQHKKIALLTGSYHSEYSGGIFTGIYKYAVTHDLSTTILIKHDHRKRTFLEEVREQQCAGVIILNSAGCNHDLNAMAKSDLPVILIDEAIYLDGVGFVDHDSYSGSREAAKYLLELGHRNIGYIEYVTNSLNRIQRKKAYENVMSEAGIEIQPEWLVKAKPYDNLYQGSFYAMQKLLKQAPELTAVMTYNDTIAIGGIKGALAMGRKIPEDLSIIGFDNYDLTEFIVPALTTVNHPINKIGYLAAQNIDQYLKASGNIPLVHDILPTKLIIRESTAPPKMKIN